MLSKWLTEGVRPSSYWQPYDGTFEGVDYKSATPPSRHFDNHRSALSADLVGSPLKPPQLSARQFVDAQIAKNLASGAIIRWRDHVGYHPHTSPKPHLILPLGVEPDKPRLIWDGRYLNLWQREVPFTMESLSSVPNLVLERGYMWTLDHHSGFHHVPILTDEQTYFGFADNDGEIYVCTVMPFGWRHAPLIYNTLTHASLSLLRATGLRNLYYTDDIFGTSHSGQSDRSRWLSANDSAYLHVYVMSALGYFLSPKSSLFPSMSCIFLGLICDTVHRRFTIPEAKMLKFLALVQSAFNDGYITMRNLESIAGRVVHFALAIPGAMFFVRRIFRALRQLPPASQPSTRVALSNASLADDLVHWLDLPIWVSDTSATWPREHHLTIQLFSDASSGTDGRGCVAGNGVTIRGREPVWGGTLHLPDREPLWASGLFPFHHRHRHINELEALGRYYVLLSFLPYLAGARVASAIDNTTARRYFNRDGGSSEFCTSVALDTFRLQRRHGFHLESVSWVASKDNPADAPSRVRDNGDYRLNPRLFMLLWHHPWFGSRLSFSGFSIDWMASHRNAQSLPMTSEALPFFSRFHDLNSTGVDFFAQPLRYLFGRLANGYINPPWVLIPAVLAYLRESGAIGTIILPELHPLPLWWSVAFSPDFCLHALRLSSAQELDVFLHPSSDYTRSLGPCPFAVWAVAFDFSPSSSTSLDAQERRSSLQTSSSKRMRMF
jgi:hypothetical protein